MEEQKLAQEIIDQANKYGDVKEITISVGDLSKIPADDIRNMLVSMTDWDINVLNEKATIECDCGYEGEPRISKNGQTTVQCKSCKKNSLKVVEGHEINLVDLTLK